MSHCYSVGVNLNGKEREVCTIVPGNEDLSKEVHDAKAKGIKPRTPTKEEIDRAIEHHLKHNHNEDTEQQKEMKDVLEDE